MSDASAALRDLVDHLSPIHAVMERGLSAKEIERLHDDLVGLENHIIDLENEIEALKFAEFERAELAADKATP